MFEYNKTDATHYRLDDGRLWSIAEARFVSSLPEEAMAVECPDESGASSLEGLVGCLDFYGFPKGELKTDAEYAVEVRAERDALIAATDYLMMPDYPLSEAKRQAVAAYRQALRDVPMQAGFPRQIDWPVKP